MDFFTVPTVTFRVRYCFFVIAHERRKILHCNVTQYPTAEVDCTATARGISGAVPLPVRDSGSGPKIRRGGAGFLHGSGADSEAHQRAGALAERAGGALDRELPEGDSGPRNCSTRSICAGFYANIWGITMMIAFTTRLQKDAPNGCIVEQRPSGNTKVLSMARLGGLHHRYSWCQAA
jgi:putative transposase